MHFELNNDVHELFREGRKALQPSAGAKAKSLAVVRARLRSTVTKPHPEGFVLTKWGVIGAGIVSALVAYLAYEPKAPTSLPANSVEEAPIQPGNAIAVATEALRTPAAVEATPAPESVQKPSQTASAGSVFRERTISKKTDRLNEEVALLELAEKQFHLGNMGESLSAIEEHQRKFPTGTLAPERVSLRGQVMCRLNHGQSADNVACR